MKIAGSENKNRIFFTVIFVIGFIVSASVMPYVPGAVFIGHGRVTADLLFALSIVCGIIYDDRKAISIIALVFGILSDIFLTPPIHISPVLFLLGAYYSSKTVSVFTHTGAVTAAIASIPFFLLRAVTGCIFIMSENSNIGLAKILKLAVLPEFACNVVTVFFAYIVVNFLYKWFKRRFFA